MIYVLEMPERAAPRVWFAYDGADLRRKLDAAGGTPGCPIEVWPDESSALAAFERAEHPLWQGQGWRARMALREQLIALEVLADDL
jgi:hypothetical protein